VNCAPKVAKDNVFSPLAKLTKGFKNIGESLKKGGEEGVTDIAPGAFSADAFTVDGQEDDLKERALNTSSKTQFLIL
jgi:hypothetical protein